MTRIIEQALAERYDSLSTKLKEAGDFIVDHPVDVATRSLRVIAHESGLAPATFSRLARALDYESFEDLRESVRLKIGRRVDNFADRAERLQAQHGGGRTGGFFDAHVHACMENVHRLQQDIDQELLAHTVEQLHAANRVLLVGELGSMCVVEYLSYVANFCTGNWTMTGTPGTSIGSSLAGLGKQDALLTITKPPFSARSISAAQRAFEQGAYVVVISDTHTCPALKYASAGFVVPTGSPHFFSSYAATMVLIEAMIGMLVGLSGPEARARIAEIEENNRLLDGASGR
ncbi:MurR/RpiR family transcriptional regulator [Coralliovum pocilloporae]|uniref:MurR/RpiR family transcriptional regulator n=1 Tax=Coralliovum pocilloporae TaxID=3066369 RepID=UPI003306F367